MPKFAKLILACLLCLAAGGAVIWLVRSLF
jgi:hypothetical protein